MEGKTPSSLPQNPLPFVRFVVISPLSDTTNSKAARFCYNAYAMPEYEFIDHTADAGIVAYGTSLEEVFVNAARAMTSLIVNPETITEKVRREIAAEGSDTEELLVAWLNEILYLFDAEGLVFRRFEITRLSEGHLQGAACGEKIDPSRHEVKAPVKAATYHQLKIERANGGFRGQVILDL